jgi:hypothetical protein
MSDPTDPPKDPKLPEFHNSPAQKSAREMVNSPGAKLAREMANSPAATLAQQYADSAAAKLTRELAGSPAVELVRQLADSPTAKFLRDMGESPTAKLSREIGLISNRELSGITAAAKAFAGITIDPSVAKALAGLKPLQIDPSVANAFAQIKSIAIAPEFAKAISEVHKALSDFGNAFGGIANAVKAIEEQNRFFHKPLVASLGGMIGDVARMSQWASTLGRMELADISSLYPTLPNAAAEVARLHGSMASLPGSVSMDQKHISAMLGLDHEFSSSLEATRLKMSAFAGVTDVLGTQTSAWNETYRALFGEWRTRPDLPQNFWRDPRVRRRMYEAAEVDPGLARANLKLAVEVVVESGLASGVRSDASAVAVISFGDVSMTIRSHGTRHDAYRVLERFEEELRAYITRKLSEKFGPDWFKLRVDGNIAGDAKRIRRQALERGETPMALINYTELGHLSSIVQGRKNWDEVFGEVFVNLAGFDLDMQKLVAARRPTMHIRPIDGVRLVELICVVQRLSRQMEDDGAWKIAAEGEQ